MNTPKSKLKIHVHDFAGHPFQAELSNRLASEGFEVLHSYFKHLGADKAIFVDTNQSGNIKFKPIVFKDGYENRNLKKRLFFELKLALTLIRLNIGYKPDFTISANTPLISAKLLSLFSRRSKFILWHQDVLSDAFLLLKRTLRTELNFVDLIQFKLLRRLERSLVASSDGVICISDAFVSIYKNWNLDLKNLKVVENWAPLSQISQIPHRGEDDRVLLLYAGTLGLKHNPSLLLELVRQLNSGLRKYKLLVISQGDGASFLRSREEDGLPIEIQDFVPLSELNKILGESDIALVLLEPEAASFSVPSKVYSYIAAGKYVIAFSPENNSAVRAIRSAGGMVFPPSREGIEQAVISIGSLTREELISASQLARTYAMENFDINKKLNFFIEVFKVS